MFSYGQFHDGAFDGLLIHDKTVYVFVSTDQKEHFVIIATGVVAMIANGMQAGNIILDVERWTAEELRPWQNSDQGPPPVGRRAGRLWPLSSGQSSLPGCRLSAPPAMVWSLLPAAWRIFCPAARTC